MFDEKDAQERARQIKRQRQQQQRAKEAEDLKYFDIFENKVIEAYNQAWATAIAEGQKHFMIKVNNESGFWIPKDTLQYMVSQNKHFVLEVENDFQPCRGYKYRATFSSVEPVKPRQQEKVCVVM